jgi:hypothetical protein
MRTVVALLVIGLVSVACGADTAESDSESTVTSVVVTSTVAAATTSSSTARTPSTTTTTTLASVSNDDLDRVRSFIDAHNAGDVDAFVALHAPDAVVRERSHAGMGTLATDRWIAEYVWKAGVDYRLELGECWLDDSIVVCSVTVSDILLEAAGMVWGAHTIRLEWDEAGLVMFFETTGYLYWADVVRSPIDTFYEWVRAEHPDEADVMFTRTNDLRFTAEAAALWQQLMPDFAQYVGGT